MRIRDAGSESMLDIVALMPWPMDGRSADFSNPIAGQRPNYNLLWLKPGGSGSLLRTNLQLTSGEVRQGNKITHRRMIAWQQVDDFPFVVAASVNARRSAAMALNESQLRRYYSTLKDINQALVSTPNPSTLCDTVCTHLVIGAHLPLAWIGTEHDRHVRVLAVSGAARGYVDGF